jgi:WD40 repeat protein
LTGSRDHTARLWDIASGRQLGPELEHPGSVEVVAFGPDARTMWTASRSSSSQKVEIRCWDVGLLRPLVPPMTHGYMLWRAHFTADGQTLITTGENNAACWWEAASGKRLHERKLPGVYHIHASAVSRPAGLLVTGHCAGGDAAVWKVESGERVAATKSMGSHLWAVDVSADGKQFLTGGRQQMVRLFDGRTGEPVGPTLPHPDQVYAVSLSPDGQMALSGGENRKVYRWNPVTGKLLGESDPHPNLVLALRFSPDGKTSITGSGDSMWRWESDTGKPLGLLVRQHGFVTSAMFSSDGRTLLLGSRDYSARLWDVATGKPLGPALQHQDEVAHAEFSPDERTIVTASHDKTARLWRTPVAVYGDAQQIRQWVEVLTGMELNPSGELTIMNAEAWHGRQRPRPTSGPGVTNGD